MTLRIFRLQAIFSRPGLASVIPAIGHCHIIDHRHVWAVYSNMQLFLLLFALSTLVASESLNETDQSLLWGPYRPNLYFGIRPRLPQSLMTGLIWFSTTNYQSVQSVSSLLTQCMHFTFTDCCVLGSRHACEQDDGLDSYTWTQYDPREGGVQEIKDSQNNVKITTEFLKVPGGKNGGSWAARIRGEPIDTCERMNVVTHRAAVKTHARLNLFQQHQCISLPCSIPALKVSVTLRCKTNQYPRFVLSIPTTRDEFKNVLFSLQTQGFDGPVTFAGSTPDLDEFVIRIEDGPRNVYVDEASPVGNGFGRTNFAGYRVEPGNIWQAKSHFFVDWFARSVLIPASRIHHGSDILSNERDPGTFPFPGLSGQGSQPRFHFTNFK